MSRIILASASAIRRELLTNAGLQFDVVPSEIDERAAEDPLADAGMSADDIALVLAETKAVTVSEDNPGAVVIGADQTLEFEGRRLSKPANMDDARRQLLALSGATHTLCAAIVVVQDQTAVWRHVEFARMTMRDMQPAEIGRYLGRVGMTALKSVGGYQIEGIGIQLFDRIDGDYFAVLGLPLLPLLRYLRSAGIIE
jgi:septum formation protein